MRHYPRASRLLAVVLAASVLIHATSCGTILYPERIGQPRGRLDPGVVVLDAVGLLLFFIPGVVAFAVDFSNGTIYLPPEGCACGRPVDLTQMTAVRVAPQGLDQRRIEEVLSAHAARPIRLDADDLRARRIDEPDQFAAQYATLLSDGSHAPPARISFAN